MAWVKGIVAHLTYSKYKTCASNKVLVHTDQDLPQRFEPADGFTLFPFCFSPSFSSIEQLEFTSSLTLKETRGGEVSRPVVEPSEPEEGLLVFSASWIVAWRSMWEFIVTFTCWHVRWKARPSLQLRVDWAVRSFKLGCWVNRLSVSYSRGRGSIVYGVAVSMASSVASCSRINVGLLDLIAELNVTCRVIYLAETHFQCWHSLQDFITVND